MQEECKEFGQLCEEELRDVWRWRNHPEVRRWMVHKEPIDWSDHLRFVEKLRNSSQRRYVKVGDLGVVNFKRSGDMVEIGMHKNPKRKGVGARLMEVALRYAFDELGAKKVVVRVFADNVRARRLYERFGFRECGIEEDMVKMELDHENRII